MNTTRFLLVLFLAVYSTLARSQAPLLTVDVSSYSKNKKVIDAGELVVNKADEGKPVQILIQHAAGLAKTLLVFNEDNEMKDDAAIKDIKANGDVVFDISRIAHEPDKATKLIFGDGSKNAAVVLLAVIFKSKDQNVSKGESPIQPTDKDQRPSPPPALWRDLQNCCCKIDLKPFYLSLDQSTPCKGDCPSCEDSFFNDTKRIVYDAAKGTTTYFSAGDNRGRMINNHRRMNLAYADPVLFIVKNVNPALYDVVLTDTAISFNLTSTDLLNKGIFDKTGEAFLTQAEGGEVPGGDVYKCVRANLIALSAELKGLFDNYQSAGPYISSCVDESKRLAQVAVDQFLRCVHRDTCSAPNLHTLLALYLNPTDTFDQALAKELQGFYQQLHVHSQLPVFRMPCVPMCDRLDFKLSITAKHNSPYASLLPSSGVTQSAYVSRYFKVDVSSGLYLGFLKDASLGIRADSETVKTSQGTDSLVRYKRLIEEENSKTPEFGFVSFLHFYYKMSHSVNLGGVIGAGISFNEPVKPRYFTGLSLMFGADNRICLNGGVVWGNYNEVSNVYSRDVKERLPFTTTDVQYQKRFRNTGFISLSYSLPYLRKKASTTTVDNGSNSGNKTDSAQGGKDSSGDEK